MSEVIYSFMEKADGISQLNQLKRKGGNSCFHLFPGLASPPHRDVRFGFLIFLQILQMLDQRRSRFL